MTTVTFNSSTLTASYTVMNVQRPFAVRTHELLDVPGRNGAILGNSKFDVAEISMDILLTQSSRKLRADALRALATILTTDEPKQLSFSDDDGKYYLAIASGGQILPYIDADVVEGVTFTCADPIMFGANREQAFAGGAATISTLGNMPCDVSFDFSTVTGGAGDIISITETLTGKKLQIPIENGTTPAVKIDCRARTVLVGGNSAVPTLASDWFEGWTNGSHAFTVDVGSVTGKIKVQDRWV